MHDDTVSLRTPATFITLCERLQTASIALRERGCLLQSIARRYYVVYTIATYLSAKYGITPARRREVDPRKADRFTHGELPDVIRVLYTGRRSGNVGPGNHPGVLSPILTEHQAVSFTAKLQDDRITADYGYIEELEPYDAGKTDARLAWADDVIEDLRTLL
jgi:hypothetical protein